MLDDCSVSIGHVNDFMWFAPPSSSPTKVPTRHACDDDSHVCDATEYGTCTPLISDPDRYRCGCADGHQCSDGDCNTVGHTCVPTTEALTVSPTGSPTNSEPTLSPTASPTTSDPTLSPSTSPTTSVPTVLPSTSPTTSVPTVLPSTSPTTSDPTTTEVSAPMTLSPIPTETLPQSSGGDSDNGSNSLVIIIGAVSGVIILVLVVALVRQRAQNETRHLPPVPPANNPAFDEPQYSAIEYDEVGNVVPARARAPQYDEVRFVRDQYAELGAHSTYNSTA